MVEFVPTDVPEFNIFPNPARDFVEIRTQQAIEDTMEFSLSETSGKLVYTGEILSQNSQLNVAILPPESISFKYSKINKPYNMKN